MADVQEDSKNRNLFAMLLSDDENDANTNEYSLSKPTNRETLAENSNTNDVTVPLDAVEGANLDPQMNGKKIVQEHSYDHIDLHGSVNSAGVMHDGQLEAADNSIKSLRRIDHVDAAPSNVSLETVDGLGYGVQPVNQQPNIFDVSDEDIISRIQTENQAFQNAANPKIKQEHLNEKDRMNESAKFNYEPSLDLSQERRTEGYPEQPLIPKENHENGKSRIVKHEPSDVSNYQGNKFKSSIKSNNQLDYHSNQENTDISEVANLGKEISTKTTHSEGGGNKQDNSIDNHQEGDSVQIKKAPKNHERAHQEELIQREAVPGHKGKPIGGGGVNNYGGRDKIVPNHNSAKNSHQDEDVRGVVPQTVNTRSTPMNGSSPSNQHHAVLLGENLHVGRKQIQEDGIPNYSVPPKAINGHHQIVQGSNGSRERQNAPRTKSNSHEGHLCSREMRRLARLEAQQTENEVKGEIVQNERQHKQVDEDEGELFSDAGSETERTGTPFPGDDSEAPLESDGTANFPGSKKKRKKRINDPFDHLPPVKVDDPLPGPVDKKAERLKKRKASKKWFSVSQFDDPLRQLLWVIFRAADKDGNDRLNKKELSTIMNSPKLDLSLTADNIKQILLDCSTVEEEEKDLKTCEISFEEFLPLGRHLLCYYYSKLDENSKGEWCILDKGYNFGIIYFNKRTGEASNNVPLDYQVTMHQHEPDLFDTALQDLFDTADMNNDGQINLSDFMNVITNRDFGLYLTKSDIEEVTRYFTSTRGKPLKMKITQFLPLAKRLIVTVYKARDPSPYDWCHLYTRSIGSFWFNKRTGESTRYPPTALVRSQQELLEHRSREIEVFMETAKDLDETRETLEKETNRRKELEAELADLQTSYNTTSKELNRTSAQLEKCKEELDQKLKMILYLEKEKTKRDQLIEKLEDRAEEADRIENNLESLRNVLQSTQSSVREKEFDIRQLTAELDDTKKKLTNANNHSADLQDKIDELTLQLREEIRRNERVENELDTTKGYKSEKVEVEDILKATKEELEMRMNQLTHARIEIRENKARLRQLESEINDVPRLQDEIDKKIKELKECQEEVDKLRREKENVEERFTKYRGVNVRRKFRRSPRLLHCSVSPSSPESAHSCSDPYCPINGHSNNQSTETSQVWALPNSCETQTPNGNLLELIQSMEGEEQEDLNIYDMYEPNGKSFTHPSSKKTAPVTPRPKSCHGRLESRRGSNKSQFLYEDDYIMTKLVKEGDRVRVWKKGTTTLGMKPSDLHSATVRYVGQLDQEGKEHMLFAGLHLDDPVGNTSGVIDGKRYFYVKRRHGKMVRITDIVYIFNPRTTSFEKVSEMMEEYKSSRRPRQLFLTDDGPKLVKVT